jgi:hypothetical protein
VLLPSCCLHCHNAAAAAAALPLRFCCHQCHPAATPQTAVIILGGEWGRGANFGKTGIVLFFQKMELIRFYIRRVISFLSFSRKILIEKISFLQHKYMLIMIF